MAKSSAQSIVVKVNDDPTYGPIATTLNGETGTVYSSIQTAEGIFYTAQFNKARSVVTNIPANLCTVK